PERDAGLVGDREATALRKDPPVRDREVVLGRGRRRAEQPDGQREQQGDAPAPACHLARWYGGRRPGRKQPGERGCHTQKVSEASEVSDASRVSRQRGAWYPGRDAPTARL